MEPKYDPRSPVTWGLHPLFHVPVKLPMSALSRMRPAESVQAGFEYAARAVRFLSFGSGEAGPIRLVQLAGYVVSVRRFPRQTRFSLDDGSGVIAHCVQFHDEGRGEEGVRLARYATVHGALEWAYEEPEVRVEAVFFSDDPNVEMLWWLDVKRVHEEVYSKCSQIPATPEHSTPRSEI